jgi:hypothetical protein
VGVGELIFVRLALKFGELDRVALKEEMSSGVGE